MAVQTPKTQFDLNNEKDLKDFLEYIFHFGFTSYALFPLIGKLEIQGRLIYANCSETMVEYSIEYKDNRLHLVKYYKGVYLYLENIEKSETIRLENVTKVQYQEPNLIIRYEI